MTKITMTSLVTIVCLLGAVDGARILAIFPFNVRSHYSVYEPLLKRPSARGHEIVAVTHFSQRIQLANFTDMDVSFVLPSRINTTISRLENDLEKNSTTDIKRYKHLRVCTEPSGNEEDYRYEETL